MQKFLQFFSFKQILKNKLFNNKKSIFISIHTHTQDPNNKRNDELVVIIIVVNCSPNILFFFFCANSNLYTYINL